MPANAIETLLARLEEAPDAPAVFWAGEEVSNRQLLADVARWRERLAADGVRAGGVCAYHGDYSRGTIALAVALLQAGAILVPLTAAVAQEAPELLAIAGAEHLYRFAPDDTVTLERLAAPRAGPLVQDFRKRGVPGLIVFTSGSTGKPKAILHDCERLARRFLDRRPGWRTVLFLMMDHFGGFSTLLGVLAYGGVGVCLPSRSPDDVCRAIAAARADLLPTTPTFLNLLLASRAHVRHDVSSVKLITYGTEMMSEATLAKVREVFPACDVKQTYGLSELGVLRSKSESDGSLWVKVGGAGFETKVVDGVLWVRSESNMVGYLNAPDPFDADGWMCTGDEVETHGDYVRFRGRKSEMINVGGQKVFPAEVENVLLQAENVVDATVYGVKHPVMGHVAHAKVTLAAPEEPEALTERLRRFALERLARFKVPMRFTIVDENEQRNERFKKARLK